MFEEITPGQLASRMAQGESWTVLDVRENDELAVARVAGVLHIPLGELPTRLGEIPTEGPLGILCHGGYRSAQACQFVAASGRRGIFNISGGIDRWSIEVDPQIPRY